MTVKDVFQLRKEGRIEEAYDAIRPLYASDKGPYTSLAMFWTATDILKKRLKENRQDEAKKIFLALERMLPNVPDKEGWVRKAFVNCQDMLSEDKTNPQLQDDEPEHLQTGIWGEELAAAYLREKNYIILKRDWHSGHRDLDIIACKDGTTIFVEVKTRRNREFQEPAHAVNFKKQRNLRLAMNHYIKYHHLTGPCRFDVITIIGLPGCTNPEIEHIEDFPI